MSFTPINSAKKSSFTPLNNPLDGFSNASKPDLSVSNLLKPTIDLGIGAVKGAANTLQNIGNLAVKPLDYLTKKITGSAPRTGISQEALAPTNTTQKIGKFGEQVAEFALPGSQIGKFSKAEGIANKAINLGTRVLSSVAVATAQEGKVGTGTGIAAGTELLLPGFEAITKPVMGIVGRLFKGLGSGLSGVGTGSIENIIKNPEVAQQVSKDIASKGQDYILEKNAKEIVNGVSKIKKEAGVAYGEGVQGLKAEDINPKTFRQSIQPILDKFGLFTEGNNRVLSNVEFSDPSNLKKASNLVDDLSKTNLDGFSFRKLMNKISDARYKIATSDERLSFNAFIDDLSNGVRQAINESTDKLGEINKKYSTDLQIAENMERIFGDVQFKNASEIGKVAQKLEGLFSQKGLNPRDIDAFLKRIDVNPEEFRTSESVRQVMNKTSGANTKGLSPTEVIQQVTSAVITPNAVKNAAVLTGLTTDVLGPILNKLAPTGRGLLIKSLMEVGNN